MKLYYDYLLVKEIIENNTIEGTTLTIKHDDTERFMIIEVVDKSIDLALHFIEKYGMSMNEAVERAKDFEEGNRFIINRVAKTPYKEGLYFISTNDIIAKIEN